MQKKNSFAVSNPPKCIANLRTQPIHFKMNLEIYQTSFAMKEVVIGQALFPFSIQFRFLIYLETVCWHIVWNPDKKWTLKIYLTECKLI